MSKTGRNKLGPTRPDHLIAYTTILADKFKRVYLIWDPWVSIDPPKQNYFKTLRLHYIRLLCDKNYQDIYVHTYI